MKRKYPFYVLKIDVAPEFVDVNVHPNKADVRFADNHVVYGAIYSIVSKVLEGNAAAIDIVKPNGYFQTCSVVETKPVTDSENKNEENGERKYADVVGCDDPVVLPDYLTRLGKFFDPVTAEKEGLFDNLPLSSPSSASTETETSEEKKLSIDDIFAENKKYIEELESRKSNTEKPTQTEISVDDNIRVVGQVLKTYLIFEKGEDIYFIDQHAAHERLLFDKFTEEYKNGKTDEQTLLVPFLYSVNEKEAEFLTSRFEYFRNAGIDVAEYEDGVFAVYALPLTLLDMDIKAFFDDVLSDMSFRKADMPDIIRDKLAQKACKAAIKSGKTLSQSEIDKLLEKLHGDMGLKCPHGRPIAIRITRTEIDKWFKRIV